MKTFVLPDLGEGLQEAEIIAWHVGEGDHVVADQPLVSVETEKAVVEIPSPGSGRVARLRAKPGDRIKVGAPLLDFENGRPIDIGTVVGTLPGVSPSAQPAAETRVKAAPAVRSRARALGLDLAAVTPSGPDATVTMTDLERAVSAGTRPATMAEPVRGLRRSMANAMARAGAEIVPANVTDEADLHAWSDREPVTARLVRAVVAGCRASPRLNAWFDIKAMTLTSHDRVDLGLAVDTADGLLVPVLRAVETRDAEDLRRMIATAVEAARGRTLPLSEMRGATITLSNFGTVGGRHASLVVLPPQVAILGAGRIDQRVRAVAGQPEIRPILPLSLTFDHRAVNGAEAVRFLGAVIADLQRAD